LTRWGRGLRAQPLELGDLAEAASVIDEQQRQHEGGDTGDGDAPLRNPSRTTSLRTRLWALGTIIRVYDRSRARGSGRPVLFFLARHKRTTALPSRGHIVVIPLPLSTTKKPSEPPVRSRPLTPTMSFRYKHRP